MHIVPIPSNPSEVGVYPVGKPTIRSALSLIRCATSNTLASREVQDAIRTRIERCAELSELCIVFYHNICVSYVHWCYVLCACCMWVCAYGTYTVHI